MILRKDVVIVGAGAAGLFCAIQAGKRGRSVTILEHNEKAGRKILASGGGNCNFANLHADPESFLCRNPHFHKSALARFTPHDFLAWVKKHEIAFVEKKAGQLFCRDGAGEILHRLLAECSAAGVEIRTRRRINTIQKDLLFRIETDREIFESESLVMATGGLSYPKLGASDFGHQIARQFHLRTIPSRPALVPLVYADEDRRAFHMLSGVSIDCVVRLHGREFRDSLLFTHHGLSGPAILQASSYWSPGEFLQIDLMPDRDVLAWLEGEQGKGKELKTVLSQVWPRRFAQVWADLHSGSKQLSQTSRKELRSIADRVHQWQLRPADTDGFDNAEATLGGVDTDELSARTMAVRKVPGLYFVGEVVDVTGHLGGFNLQWAWSSGYAAGMYC